MEAEHRELLIGLLGSTYGEMKKLDDSIMGSSSTLNRRSEKVKQELTNIIKNVAPPPDVQILQRINQEQPPVQPVPQYQPAQQPVIVNENQWIPQQPITEVFTSPTEPAIDTNQLELDLDKHAKYDDVMNYLYTITERLNKIEDKIDKLIKNGSLPKVSEPLPKKKVSQSNSGLVQS